ncbi:MBL fold metallo-hydrolase [Thalassobaculum sp.]|uniref:ComEC/Rec2 family competence protein n=1 Tax=Thalassobaculum sp. TaxID=2022740 RepID=UPI0032EF5541
MLTIEIFDVGHGACSVVTLPNGRRIMVDCGCDTDRSWWPSVYFMGVPIDLLVLQNLDADHIQDIAGVLDRLKPRAIYSNPSVDAAALAELKAEHGMNGPLTKVHQLLARFGPRMGPWRVPLPDDVEATLWYLTHDPHAALETNDLSVVLTVRYGTFRIVFGGDLERRGWLAHLSNFGFWSALGPSNVFVASHHGRRNGLCAEALTAASPEIVVISDKEMTHASQETVKEYRRYCRGIPDYTRTPDNIFMPWPRRHVLTTRKDGDVRIEVAPDGRYTVTKHDVVRETTMLTRDLLGSGYAA